MKIASNRPQKLVRPHVSVGSKAEVSPLNCDDRFPPKADIHRHDGDVGFVSEVDMKLSDPMTTVWATGVQSDCRLTFLEHQAPSSTLDYRIAFRRLSRHPSQHDRFLSRYPKIPRCLERAPDIGIFRAAIERNQIHAMRALHLIAVAEPWGPFAERLAAFGTDNLYPVGHGILPQEDYQPFFRISLI
jgi:hypothetical protein